MNSGNGGGAMEQYKGAPDVGTTQRNGFGTTEMTRAAETSMTAAAEQARALVQARFIVAMQRPRDMDDVRMRLLKECRRPSFAAVARYRKPVGGGSVEGASVRFVEGALRCMGNVDQSTSTVFDDDQKMILRVEVTDIEANTTFKTDITVRKVVERKDAKGREVISSRTNSAGETTYLVSATDDELANKVNALVSKALRNNGLRIIPGDLVDEGQAVAKETRQTADAADPDAARKRISDAFGEMGIMPSELKAYLDHDLSQASPAELEELRGAFAAVKDGDVSWKSLLEAKKAERAPAASSGATEAGKDSPVQTVADRMKQKVTDARTKRPGAPTPPVKADADGVVQDPTGSEG